MTRKNRIWLFAATVIILLGLVIFGSVMTMLKWDFKKLSTAKYEDNSYEISESYHGISVDTDTAELVFVPSEDGKTSVSCHEQSNLKHSVSVVDGTLTVKLCDTRNWFNRIFNFSFEKTKILISIPSGDYGVLTVTSSTGDIYVPHDFIFEGIDVKVSTGDVTCLASVRGDVKIKTSTGDITVEKITADSVSLSVSTGRVTASGVSCYGNLDITVSTGKTYLTDVSCENLTSNGDTGDISLSRTVAKATLSVTRSTGSVSFDGADAAEIYVTTDTGSVMGRLLTDKVYIVNTDTGRVDVPKTTSGGRCEITTDTGNIIITVGPNPI